MINFENGDSVNYPYPYIFIDECFDDEILQNLINEFPDTNDSPFVMGGRNQMENSKPHIGRILEKFEDWIDTAPTWKQFYKWLNTDSVLKSFLSYYREDLNKWGACIDENSSLLTDCFLHMDWSSASDGYVREIHTDSKKRILNFLIFFNDKEWEGGDFLIHSSDNIHTLDHQLWNEKLPISQVVEAKKNRGLFFLSTPDSYHSVSEQFNTNTPRKFIYGSYSFRSGDVFKIRNK